MRTLTCLAAVLLAAAGGSLVPLDASARLAAPSQAPSAAEIAARVQRRYASIRDFSADFTQTYQGGVLRQKTTERGTVLIKKPGRMRWSYTSPEKKEFVSDGQKLYSYIPSERQVYVNDVPAGGGDTSAALFLAGRGDLTRDFTPELAGSEGSTYQLELTPKQRQQDFDTLTLIVDRNTMQIVSLVAADRQGGTSTFVFSNFKENIGVDDSRFAFKAPRGVRIVKSDG
jgi:outer membrane lipoprotein carrier protein